LFLLIPQKRIGGDNLELVCILLAVGVVYTDRLSGKTLTKFIGRQKRFKSFFVNSQCIDSNGRTFVLLIKKCPILDNSTLSLEFGSLGILDFQCFRVSYFAFSLNLSNSTESSRMRR